MAISRTDSGEIDNCLKIRREVIRTTARPTPQTPSRPIPDLIQHRRNEPRGKAYEAKDDGEEAGHGGRDIRRADAEAVGDHHGGIQQERRG